VLINAQIAASLDGAGRPRIIVAGDWDLPAWQLRDWPNDNSVATAKQHVTLRPSVAVTAVTRSKNSRELGKHYAKADHVQWWREQIKERGSLEAVYREVRKRQREYRDRDVG
jgi:hypothetical protein